MLKTEVTTQPDAIENYFCKPFERLPKHQMDDFTAEMLLKLMFSKSAHNIPEKEKPPIFRMLEKRLEACYTITIPDTRLRFFLIIIARTPGLVVAYLTYLQYWAKKHNMKELTLDIFAQRIFPMGFPSEQDISTLWEEVKVESEDGSGARNLLDFGKASESIHFL